MIPADSDAQLTMMPQVHAAVTSCMQIIPEMRLAVPVASKSSSMLETKVTILCASQANGESQVVRRHARDLAACLACDICRGLLREPLTAPHCMHVFCRPCIAAFIVTHEVLHCPVCQTEGVQTTFGTQPFRDHLRADFMLTDLLRKVRDECQS